MDRAHAHRGVLARADHRTRFLGTQSRQSEREYPAMTSISRAQALTISHPQVRGSYLPRNNTDQLLVRLPKVPIRGDSYQCARIETLATAAFVSSGGATDASATTYAATARNFPLRRIAAKAEVNTDIAQNVSMINDVFQQQIEAKQIAIWNTVGTKLISGDNADPNPAGLEFFAAEHPAGVINGGGATLTLANLDDMIKEVRPWSGRTPRYFVMNRGQYARVCALARAAGFALQSMPDPLLGEPLLHFSGVPILVSDWITDAEDPPNNRTSVYLVVLGTREGEPQYGGLVWFYNEDTGAGVRVDGPHRTSSAVDMLFADLEVNIGFATLSTGAVLRRDRVAQ
jgi:hypothetical protein